MVLTLLKLDGGNYKFVGQGGIRVWVSKGSFPGGVAPATLDVTALGLAVPAPKVKAAPTVDALGSALDVAAGVVASEAPSASATSSLL